VGLAERHDRGPGQPLTDVAEPARAAGAGVLLEPDDLLVGSVRPRPPCSLGQPTQFQPDRAEVLLPHQALVEQGLLVAGPAAALDPREVAFELLGEPGARLGAEGFVSSEKRRSIRSPYRCLTTRQKLNEPWSSGDVVSRRKARASLIRAAS